MRPDRYPYLVLIVDDHQDIRELYAQILQRRGFGVAEAADGYQAIHKAHALVPDVILMDLTMPTLDGWEATRRLKTNPATRHIWIVAISGDGSSQSGTKARDAGADDYILKPCLPDDLLARIERAVTR